MSSPPQQDPYKVLGIAKDADLSAVKRAYRQLVLKCHPDKFQDDALKAIKVDEFHKVQQAYDLLSDESKRAQYDEQIKLYELRKEMGRGGAPPTPGQKNVFDYEIRTADIRTAEPRSSTFKTKVYARTPPRSHEDDVRASSFEEPSRTRAKKTAGYEERKRPSTRDGERSRRSEEERDYERWEKEKKRSMHGEAKKSRDKERKRGTEEKFTRSTAAYVDDDSDDAYYRSRSERKSSREKEEDLRAREKAREKIRKEEELRSDREKKLDDHLNTATQYMQAARSKVQDFRPGALPRAATFHESPYSSRYGVPSSPMSPYFDDDDSPRRSSAPRSTSRRSSEQIPIRPREETRSSGRERKTSPYERDPYVHVVDAAPLSPTLPSLKKPTLQSYSSAPPVIPTASTSRREPHRSKTMQPEYTRKESSPPLPRAATFQHMEKSKSSSRGSKLKTHMAYASDGSDSDGPAHYSSPRAITPPPRRREPEISTYRVENGHTVPVSRHRTALRDDDYGAGRDRSVSPLSNRRNAERPPLMRSSGSGGQTSFSRGDSAPYYSGQHTAEPIIKEARPKLSTRDSSSSRRGGSYFGEVNYARSFGLNDVSYSKDPFRRGSDPSSHRDYAYPTPRTSREAAYA